MFHKIYSLLLAELDILRKYLNNILRKEYIRPLISKVGYPIIFVEELRDRLIGK